MHPSPLSASRGFFDGHHFRKSNEWLLDRYGPDGVINWALDPSNEIREITRMKKREHEKDQENSTDEKTIALEDKENAKQETEVPA